MVSVTNKGQKKVGKTSSVVEINGNRYDVATGQLISSIQKVVQVVKPSSTGVIDGITRKPSILSASAKVRGTAQHVHKRAQHSSTLMRQAVSKPKTSKDNHTIKARKIYSTNLDFKRHHRAKVIDQDSRVEHFGIPRQTPSQNRHPEDGGSRIESAKQAMVLRPKVAASVVSPPPSMVTSVSHQHLERLLDEALTRADAHKKQLNSFASAKNPWQKLTRLPRWASIGSVTATALLLVGFFAWQNVPQVAMRVAAAKAHVSAAVPAYTPSGFGFAGPISTSANAVTMKFKASGDANRTFALTQQRSNWDSKSLQSNAISQDSQVQTSVVKGTTVYIYGNKNDATWVNHGIRYTLRDQANLNSDQILRIADSL